MPEAMVLDRLLQRHAFQGSLKATTALHVGAGKADEARSLTDMPVVRNGAGQPYIPGSSLRGVLRSSLEALLRGLEANVCNPLNREPNQVDTSCSARLAERRRTLNNLNEDQAFALVLEESCEICRIFGNSFLASRVWIPDLPLNGAATTYTRDGVGIDRDLRTAANRILYNFEAVAAGASFCLRLDVENGEDHELGLILTGFSLLEHGLIGLGGKRARGLGGVKLVDVSVKRWQPDDFFTVECEGSAVEEQELEVYRKAARSRYAGGGDDV